MAIRFQRTGVRFDGRPLDTYYAADYFNTPLGFNGGNDAVVLGGYANILRAWSSPVSGATALTLALTIKPDVPFTPVPSGDCQGEWGQGYARAPGSELMNQWGGSGSYTAFRFWHVGAGRLAFQVNENAQGGAQKAQTEWRALRAGVWNRLVARWRGSDGAMSIWVDAFDRTDAALSSGRSTYINNNSATSLVVGAVDANDWGPAAGNYAEAAIWTAYLSDADVRAYGRGASPNLLASAGRCRYAKLRMEGEDSPLHQLDGGSYHGYVWEEWTGGTGYAYGHDLTNDGGVMRVYQGYFQAYDLAAQPHPTVFYSIPGEYLPVAYFTYAQATVGPPDEPVTIQFTDASLGATGWTWDFGDGTPVSHAQSPSHAFLNSGDAYLVTLTVTSPAGTSEPTTRWITQLYAAVSARFGCAQDPHTLDVRTLCSSIGPATTRTWSWGDSSPDTVATAEYAFHTYAAAGTYTVSLTVSNPLSGPSSLSRQITVVAIAADVVAMPTTDATLLPEREFQLYERTAASLGVRGTPTVVTTFAQLQSAVSAAQYGDIIQIPHGTAAALTQTANLLLPDIRNWTLDDTTPRMPPMGLMGGITPATLTGEDAPTALGGTPLASGCLPAYVLITSDGTLPPIAVIRITTEESTTYPILDAAARIEHHDAAELATIHTGGFQAVALWPQQYPSGYFYFRGIQWLPPDDAIQRSFFSNLAGYEEYGGYGYDRNCQRAPDHLVFQQCIFDCDPYLRGRSGGLMAGWDGAYLAFINCLFDNFYIPSGGGDPHLTFSVSSVGPHLLENNQWWTAICIWFVGGAGSNVVTGITQDFIARRNVVKPRREWIYSECNPWGRAGTYTVSLDATGYAGVLDAKESFRGPRMGDYLVDRTTGLARICDEARTEIETGDDHQVWVRGWPTLPSGTISCFWQRWGDEPETSPTLYNSGIATPMPLATTWAGGDATRVTFDTQLPADIPPRLSAGEKLYFYLNNTYFGGLNSYPDAASNARTATDPLDTTWGLYVGRHSEADAARKRIASIDSDRMGLTLANPYFADVDPPYAGKTFPFSIVRGSGLYCDSFAHDKGAFENKTGRRFLLEGNIWPGFGGRIYTNNQHVQWASMPILAYARVTPTTVTLLDGQIWPINPYSGASGVNPMRATLGAPGGWTSLTLGGHWSQEYTSRARAILRTTSDHEAVLVPPDAGMASADQDSAYVGPVGTLMSSAPWMTLRNWVIRYNVIGGTPCPKLTSYYGGASIPGGYFSYHDNISVAPGDHGDTAWWVNILGLAMNQNVPKWNPYYCAGLGGSPNYGTVPRRGDNSLIRYTHNTVVRVPAKEDMRVWAGQVPSWPKATGLILDDNLVMVDRGTALWVTGDTSSNPLPDPTLSWGSDCTSARNVFAGPNAIMRQSFDFFPSYPDNAAVTAPDPVGGADAAVGFVDYHGTLYDIANYVLTDILTGQTATIAANGMSATVDSGTLPSRVTVGQFFSTTTTPATQKRITAISPDAGLTLTEPWLTEFPGHSGLNGTMTWALQPGSQWDVNGYNQAWGGRVYTSPVPGTLTWARCLTSLGGPDHEVVGTCLGLEGGITWQWAVITRKAADTDGTFYFVANRSVGSNVLRVGLMQGGVVTYYQDLPNLIPRQPATLSIGLRSIGTHHYVLIGGVPVYDWVDAHWAGGAYGGIAGDPGGGYPRWASVTLRGSLSGLRLQWGGDPHPEANESHPFVVTFKGTATDGSDPGANIPMTAAMVQGLLDVGPLPTAPTCTIDTPTSDATYTATTSTVSLAGHASDDVGVTSVTWVNLDGGTNGTATGTTDWSIADIPLVPGSNVIRVTAHNAANLGGSDTLTVTWGTPLTVTIQTPTAGVTYATTSATITLTGTASDAVGVTSVTWTNDRGGGDTASGTTAWSFTATLQPGVNLLTVTAHNAVPETATDTLTVTYNAPVILRTKFRASSKVSV